MPFENRPWCPRAPHPDFDPALACALARELHLPPLIATLLGQRGYTSREALLTFLHPSLANLPSPFLMKDMDLAVALIIDAGRAGRPIIIFGDYDVDGATGTAVLFDFLCKLDIEPHCYQPNRLKEGYGLNLAALEVLAARHTGALLITVDCGISNRDEVLHAKHLGFDVIITDHHLPPSELPLAGAILNPRQPGCAFPFKDLAGVGVAFYLAMGLRSRLVERGRWSRSEAPNLKASLDLVALGTVADMVSLTGVNRILVSAGLEVLAQTNRPGLRALMDKALGPEYGLIDAVTIGFKLGPRLNAAGRLGSPGPALELLITQNIQISSELSEKLEALNDERRRLGEEAAHLVSGQCEELVAMGRHGLVVQGDYHSGVIGIVASRMIECFHRPIVVFSQDGSGLLKGSGRSVEGVHLHGVLGRCADLLERFGGHAMAAGMSMVEEHFEAFCERFDREVRTLRPETPSPPAVTVDYHGDAAPMFDEGLWRHYRALGPFGEGNPEPLFFLPRVQLSDCQVVGNGHLRFSLRENGSTIGGIAFGRGDLAQSKAGGRVDLVCHLRPNFYRGREQRQIFAVDIRPV